ncbi:ROK family transcriptional regulator [Nocardia tengchongensis]|uniref:ROK family transcriptional regulator n=1 Tax=Nocardia tengchongensis TaxID=2055889 RepID=UPI00364EDE88
MSGRPTATPGVSVGDVFASVRAGTAATRSDIARLTGLSRTAVTMRVEQLLAHGLITERAEGPSTGGRPPTRLAVDPRAALILAASVGASRAQVAVCDLIGQPLTGTEFDIPDGHSGQEVLTAVADQLDRLLAELGPGTAPIFGVGIGVPSAVDMTTGHSMNPAGLGEVAVSEFFAERFGVPVRVDSDVNVLALSEFTHRPDAKDLLLLKVSTGVGVGIIAGGALQRGAWGAAGEIGHIKVPAAADRACRCGDRGCLETVAAGWALLEQSATSGHHLTGLPQLAERAVAGDPDALRLVRAAGRSIGEVMAAAVNLLNPAVIVICGDLSQAADPLIAGLRERIYQYSSALNTRTLRIEAATHAASAGVDACAAMILDHILAPAAINTRIGGIPASTPR